MGRRTTGRAAAALALLLWTGGCAPAIIAGAGAGGLGFNAVREERGTDDQIADLQAEMAAERRIGALGDAYGAVGVEVWEGRALLTGAVPDAGAARRAAETAQGVRDVREVLNELRVGPAPSLSQRAEDAWIASQIRARLVADPNVAGVNYSIETSNGVVHLVGLARSPAELRRVARIASDVTGVREVVSHVLLIDDPRRKPA